MLWHNGEHSVDNAANLFEKKRRSRLCANVGGALVAFSCIYVVFDNSRAAGNLKASDGQRADRAQPIRSNKPPADALNRSQPRSAYGHRLPPPYRPSAVVPPSFNSVEVSTSFHSELPEPPVASTRPLATSPLPGQAPRIRSYQPPRQAPPLGQQLPSSDQVQSPSEFALLTGVSADPPSSRPQLPAPLLPPSPAPPLPPPPDPSPAATPPALPPTALPSLPPAALPSRPPPQTAAVRLERLNARFRNGKSDSHLEFAGRNYCLIK